MKSYLDLVSAYGKVHKKKNRLTVVCIAISVMLVTAIFGMADMSVKAQINEVIRQSGNYHAVITGIPDDTAERIASRKDVKVSGWVGMSETMDYGGKPLLIQGGEQDMGEQMNLIVTQGRYPATPGEALLDRQGLTAFRLSIGDTIAVTLSDGTQRAYTITGTHTDFSSLKGTDTHGLTLTTQGLRQLPAHVYAEYYYIQFSGGVDIPGVLSELRAAYGLSEEQVSTNVRLLGMMGQSDDSAMEQLYLTAVILFLLVAMAGTFMIASSFNMSILERAQFFGLLRCLGATKRQVKRYVRLEGVRYCLKGIPIGLLAGCGVLWAAIFFVNTLSIQEIPTMPMFQISLPGVVAGGVIGILVVMIASRAPARQAARVSPVAAVTGNLGQANQNSVRRASNTKRLHVDTAMGLRHALENKKSMVLIAGSFTISIVLFLCFTVFISFMGHALTPLKPYTADLSIKGARDGALLDRALLEQISALPQVREVYGRMFFYDIPAEDKGGTGTAMLLSYDDQQFQWAEEMLVSGSIEAVQNCGVMVDYDASKQFSWEIGDAITLHMAEGEREVRIAAIVSDVPFQAGGDGWPMVCSESTFTGLTGMSDYTIIDMQVSGDISQQVRALITPELQLLDQQQRNSETRAGYYAMAVFVYGFLIVIALVALINILNTVSAGVSSRIGHYGVMRAVGMSGKQLKKVVIAEAVTYAVTGSIAGGALGLATHRLFFGLLITSNWGDVWQPPLEVLAVAITAAILTTFIAVVAPTKKIEETSIVDVVNAG